MTEFVAVLVVCAIAYKIAFSPAPGVAFVSQADKAAQALPKPDLAAVRKQLAADEKLTPELRAAFDLIQRALEEK